MRDLPRFDATTDPAAVYEAVSQDLCDELRAAGVSEHLIECTQFSLRLVFRAGGLKEKALEKERSRQLSRDR